MVSLGVFKKYGDFHICELEGADEKLVRWGSVHPTFDLV